jgi:hypothetical protein
MTGAEVRVSIEAPFVGMAVLVAAIRFKKSERVAARV